MNQPYKAINLQYLEGCITAGYLYAPFGEILQEHSAVDNRIPKYAFNAKELDEENGMYYYSARYYAPPTFISRDPLMDEKPWLTPYHYCSNNPINKVDPTGMFDDEWDYDLETKTLTWVSNKGGNTTQHVNAKGKTKTIESSTDGFVENVKSHGITVNEEQGRGGVRVVNNRNYRESQAPKTNEDVDTWDLTDIIPLLESSVNTLIDFADKVAGFFKKSEPTTTPQNNTPEPEPERDGCTFEYAHPSIPNEKQYRYAETIDDSLNAVRDLKNHGLKIYKVTPSYKKK